MNAAPLRILIVDDSADNARMLKVLLQKESHEASIVFDGPTAIAAASIQKPDVVLLDLSLPGMSGLAAAAELRSDPDQKGCVLVGISGHG
jgi:CheY-like chemotaxis protein